jgi:hypothetical protein
MPTVKMSPENEVKYSRIEERLRTQMRQIHCGDWETRVEIVWNEGMESGTIKTTVLNVHRDKFIIKDGEVYISSFRIS